MDSYQPYPIRPDAVLCSLAELPDGGLRVVMDDLRQTGEPGQWQNRIFVTFTDSTNAIRGETSVAVETQ